MLTAPLLPYSKKIFRARTRRVGKAYHFGGNPSRADSHRDETILRVLIIKNFDQEVDCSLG